MTPSPRPWLLRALAGLVAGVLLLLAGCSSQGPAAAGERIKGKATAIDAPTLGTGDAWDELGAPGTDAGVRVYAIERDRTEEGITVAVNVVAPAAEEGFNLKLTSADETTCDQTSESSIGTAAVLSGTVNSRQGSSSATSCVQAQRLLLTVTRTGKAAGPIHLRLRLTRMPAANPQNYPEVDTPKSDDPIPLGAGEPGKPGEWLSDAGSITPGTTYTGSIGTGRIHTYRVSKVKWGQQVRVTLNHPNPPPSQATQIEESGIQGELLVVQPSGQVTKSTSVFMGYRGGGTGTVTTTPVALNSANDRPGDYTIIIGATSKKETTTMLAYQFSTQVIGGENNALGPDVAMTTTTSGGFLPEPVLWGLLVAGVFLVVVGMAQVALSRQR